jgi:streptogramin lyase
VATTNAFSDADDKRGEILGLDLETGETVARLGPAGLMSVNDLTVAPNGDLWATDTAAGAVVRFKGARGSAERITPEGGMAYPNGIAVSDDGRHVFVAQGASLRRIDAETGAVLRLPHPPDLTTLGIDGLYWIEGALVGVQNGGTAGRVIRLELTPARDAIARWSVLEGGGPAFDTPTTGAPAPGRLYVLANSQIQLLRPDGSVAEPDKLKPILILETPLSGA